MNNRKEVFSQIEETLGMVPTFFKSIPDNELANEWELFRMIELDDGPIPQKYRELIGIGIAAATKCRYCTLFHTEAAKLFGATDEEVEHALHYAKNSAGWSTYLNGLQLDFEQFRDEVEQIATHVRSMQSGARASSTKTARPATRPA